MMEEKTEQLFCGLVISLKKHLMHQGTCIDLVNHDKGFTINSINQTLAWEFQKISFKLLKKVSVQEPYFRSSAKKKKYDSSSFFSQY